MAILEKIRLKSFEFDGGRGVDIVNERLLGDQAIGCLSILRFEPGTVRPWPNHYHTEKWVERFYLMEGKVRAVVEDIRTKEKEDFTWEASESIMIRFRPYVAHAYKNVGEKTVTALTFSEYPHVNGRYTVKYEVISGSG